MKENADAYRQKVDVEEHVFHRLIGTDQTQNQKIHKVNMVNLVSIEGRISIYCSF